MECSHREKEGFKLTISDVQEFAHIEHVHRQDDVGNVTPKIEIKREAHLPSAYLLDTGIISLSVFHIMNNVSPKVARLLKSLSALALAFSHSLMCLRFEECE